ncbi:MAG: NAD(P)H-hydrate dehydratase [Burkholderiales bacterium]|nr:NAD(P)H-hydrate dehydratase [Burkholderiales bacterium]
MQALYSVAEIRQIEHAAEANLPAGTLMQRAGKAAAEAALSLITEQRAQSKVLVLAGPGNNGGDALELAYHLAQAGVAVNVALFADPAKQSPDARQALKRAQNSSAKFVDVAQLSALTETDWSLVVDGLFGIGLMRPIAQPLSGIVESINRCSCPILALDVPSGLDADTGDIVGPDGVAIHATDTITFIGDKPGLHTCYGHDYAGMVHVAGLEIDSALYPQPHAALNRTELFRHAFHPRPQNSHKGSFGNVTVIGGAKGMSGAPVLAGRAAAKCGAGRVFVGFLEAAPAYDSAQPELMCRAASQIDYADATLVVGPGLGTSREAHDELAHALNTNTPMVLDADALNLIAAESGLQQKLAARKAPTLLTPHPLEAARLLSLSAGLIQADRLTAAREIARRFHVVAVLKGSGSVIARPDGLAIVNPTGNAALASAGTGDVLAGVCGALLAQGIPMWESALAAVWLHGHAADTLVNQGVGPIGVTASELIPEIRAALNRLPRQDRQQDELN